MGHKEKLLNGIEYDVISNCTKINHMDKKKLTRRIRRKVRQEVKEKIDEITRQ